MSTLEGKCWLTKAELGEFIQASKQVVDRIVREGRVTVRQLPGTRPRYSRESAEAFLEACTRQGS